METEGRLIINQKPIISPFKIINSKKIKHQNLLYFFIFILILFNVGIIIFIIINKNKSIYQSNFSNGKLLKLINVLSKKLSNLEEIINIKEKRDNLNQLTKSNNIKIKKTNYNIEENEIFNQKINEKYKKEQSYFCENSNLFYNKKFEDKIKKVEVKLEDKNYNMYVYRKSDVVSGDIITYNNYEKKETKRIIEALKYVSNKRNIKNENIYILDIGANIGWYSYIFGKYGYKVISFEPSKLNYYILKKNYCLNRETNVTIINKGLYTEEKQCDLHLAIENEGDGIVVCENNQNLTKGFYKKKIGEIRLTKLSNYIPFLLKKNLILIKIDVEGSEGKAIEGGIELITNYHVPFIFLEFCQNFLKLHGTEPKKLLELFIDNGYKISISNFFENYISVDDIINTKYLFLNLYIIYSKIIE